MTFDLSVLTANAGKGLHAGVLEAAVKTIDGCIQFLFNRLSRKGERDKSDDRWNQGKTV